MKQPNKNKKLSVKELKKLAKDRDSAIAQKKAQGQYDEVSTPSLNSNPFGDPEEAAFTRKMMLLEQAEAGSEMAIHELQQAGVDIHVPDADASGLTTWLFAGPAKAGLAGVKGAAMMAGKQGPKWASAIKKFSDYYKTTGKTAPKYIDDMVKRLKNPQKALPGPKGVTPTPAPSSTIPRIGGPTAAPAAAAEGSMLSKMAGYGKQAWEYTKANPVQAALRVAGLEAARRYGVDAYNYMTSDVTDKYDEWKPITQEPEKDGLRTGGLKYENGGEVLDGGTKSHVAGKLFEYKGNSHEQGGITEGNIEVEGGEMEYQNMPMSDGSDSDYIFSDKLRYGGATFAEAAKSKMQQGAPEGDMLTLAKIQESAASNKGERGRSPDHIKEYGGFKKMEVGGPTDPPTRKNLGEDGIAASQSEQEDGYYSSKDTQMIGEEGEREDFFNRNKDLLVGLGIETWQDYDPAKHAGMFQSAVNVHLKKQWEADPALQERMKKEGITDAEGYVGAQGFSGDSGPMQNDDLHGEGTNGITTQMTTPVEDAESQKELVEKTTEEVEPVEAGPDYGPLVGAAQMLPVFAALGDKPDYISQADPIAPGVVRAEREAKVNLDRVDYTDQMSRNSQDAAGLNRFIETSGGGSSNMANKMAVFAKKKAADRAIKSDESKANTAIGNQEAGFNVGVASRNASNALGASKINASNILAASDANAKNKMYTDEFNRGAEAATFDRKLNALQTGTANISQIYRDRLSYDAETRKADAIAGETGINTREAADRMTLLYGKKPKTT